MTDTLIDRLKENGAVEVSRLVESETQESLTLDFKANVPESGDAYFASEGKKLSKLGRRSLSKAVSSFANSMGGLLLLGVDCRKNDGVDCAGKLTPIPHLSRSISTINNELHALTTPPINGIDAFDIPIDDTDTGYIAVTIPRSARRPHRVTATRAKSYYKRSGSSTVEMEHYEIEEAFLSNTGPDLTLFPRIVFAGRAFGPFPDQVSLKFLLGIVAENRGGGLAKHVFLQGRKDLQILFEFGDFDGLSKNETSSVGSILQSAPPHDFVVHPGTQREIETIPMTLIYNKDSKRFSLGGKVFTPKTNQPLEFELTISAEGMRVREQSLVLQLSDLIHAIPPRMLDPGSFQLYRME
ncbi:MAG: ATP-binding protein [Stappiaceae bacterium]